MPHERHSTSLAENTKAASPGYLSHCNTHVLLSYASAMLVRSDLLMVSRELWSADISRVMLQIELDLHHNLRYFGILAPVNLH
jgi:hypothetical protein